MLVLKIELLIFMDNLKRGDFMKRHESGYGMKIVMKPSATEKQMEIARKIYPNAIIIKEVETPKVNFKQNEFINSKTNSTVTSLSNEKILTSTIHYEGTEKFYKEELSNNLENIKIALAS